MVEVYEASDDEKFRGAVTCNTFRDVSKALLDISENDGTIDLHIGRN